MQRQSFSAGCGLIAGALLIGVLLISAAIGAVVFLQRQTGGAVPAVAPAVNAPAPVAPQATAIVPAAASQATPVAPVVIANSDAPQVTAVLPPEPQIAPPTLPSINEATLPQAQQVPLPTYTPNASLTPYPTFTPMPTPTPMPSPTPLPVVDWKRSGTLNVLDWTTTIVIEKSRAKEGVRTLIPGQDRVVLVVNGRLRAGVDLTRVEPNNVAIDGTSIRIVVPRPTIYSIELLPEESRVYDAERSWLFSEYSGLEVEAMEQAKRQLGEPNPTNTRMLETAEAVARLQLTNFLRDVGFQKVEVIFAK